MQITSQQETLFHRVSQADTYPPALRTALLAAVLVICWGMAVTVIQATSFWAL